MPIKVFQHVATISMILRFKTNFIENDLPLEVLFMLLATGN